MKTIEIAKKLWAELGDIPVNEDMELDEEFNPENYDAVFSTLTSHRHQICCSPSPRTPAS